MHRAAVFLAIALAPIYVLSAPASVRAAGVLEAETMSLPSSYGTVFSDAAAGGSRALLIWSNGTATANVTTAALRRVVVRARGDQCGGAPQMTVALDGSHVTTQAVGSTSWASYAADFAAADGAHTLRISFTNDAMAPGCDRNLRVDSVTLSSTAAAPFAGARWWVDPHSTAARQAEQWRLSRPADAAAIDKIARNPQADWFGEWSGDVRAAVAARVDAAAGAGAVAQLVAYAIPQRDCGSYSTGGAGTPSSYKSWIRSLADGIGDRRAAVVLEPDALAGIDCLSAADRETRFALLRDAVAVLSSHPGVSVYLDAGHSRWRTAPEMAALLGRAGVERAQGFALNVSNYRTTGEASQYGQDLAARLGGKHFVVDTSRNGLGPAPDGQWCNAPGRALGNRPTAVTYVSRADAWLWIKRPGESDGPCNGGPPAGAWWPEYALGLAQRAAY